MRTILLTVVLLALIPIAILKPWIGALTWTWISVMNPHKLTFGFLRDFPVAAIVAGATIVGLLVTRDRRPPPMNAMTWTLLAFVLWMCVTSAFALYPDHIGVMFSKVMKIQLMIFVTLALLYTRAHVEMFVWVLVLSLGFYGFKGGLYTLLGGGVGKVFGPPGGFMEGNNELALGLTMCIPLMYYQYAISKQAWLRYGMAALMLFTAMSIVGSQSRGALLAIVAMALYLWRHSKQKIVLAIVLCLLAVGVLAFMPIEWEQRMQTIANYESDTSAMGRINAWWMAINLASDRLLGGGFEVAMPDLFARYAPNPLGTRAAHSIYFQVLGEHGFVGLGLFLLFWFFTWRGAGWVHREARKLPGMESASLLAAMVQVTLVGYFVGGAFLSLAYFDLPYDMMIIVVMLNTLVRERIREGGRSPVQAPIMAHPSGGG